MQPIPRAQILPPLDRLRSSARAAWDVTLIEIAPRILDGKWRQRRGVVAGCAKLAAFCWRPIALDSSDEMQLYLRWECHRRFGSEFGGVFSESL